MVCVPCIVVPLLLWIWHRFLQPYVFRYWNPWKSVNSTNDSTDENSKEMSCPIKCFGDRCELQLRKKANSEDTKDKVEIIGDSADNSSKKEL